MNPIDEKIYIEPFGVVSLLELPNGYIVWRRGTGENVELLHLKTFERGMGTGKTLVCSMLQILKDDPPYSSVFGFTRSVNMEAQKFYRSLGFILSPVEGVYADGTAVLFSQTFEKLLELNNDCTLYE